MGTLYCYDVTHLIRQWTKAPCGGFGHGWQYPAKPWSDLSSSSLLDWLLWNTAVQYCTGIPSLWNMGLEKMNKPAMSIVLPGRIPSHSLRKDVTSPQQNRGVSPSLSNFCLTTAQRLLKNCPSPAPAPATVTNTTRVRQGANASDLTFELEGWGGGGGGGGGGGEEAWRAGELRKLYLMYPSKTDLFSLIKRLIFF